MIQRVQSLYLLGILILVLVLLTANIELSNGKAIQANKVITYSIGASSNTIHSETDTRNTNLTAIISFSALALYAFLVIFFYKNLKQQLIFTRTNYLLIIVLISAIYYSIHQATIEFDSISEQHYSIGLYLSLLTLIFNFMAYRGIKRDIDLIGSADRLR